MASARVSSLASVVSLQAKNSSGVWRDLTEGSSVADGEEILCEADGPQFGLNAYKLQQRTAAAWTDAATLTLDTAAGSSDYRQDRISVAGDDTDSTVAILVTVEKGQALMRDALATLQSQERVKFTLEDGSTRFRGITDDIEHGNKPELGGFGQEFKGQMLCDRAQFVGLTAPARGQKITIVASGISYRIEAVRVDEISYLIDFTSVNKG